MKRKLTLEQLAEAAALRDGDSRFWTYARLAERYGVSAPGICNALSRTPGGRPSDRRERRKRNFLMHEVAEQKRAAKIGPVEHFATRSEALTRLKEIPADTRDFTARFFGDPLPGRSAMDLRNKSGEGA